MTVNLYFYDDELNMIDKGEFDITRLDMLFDNRLANGKMVLGDDFYEVYISKTTFILSRSKIDFLEVSVIDDNKVTLFSDKLCYSNTLFDKIKKIFSPKVSFINNLEFDWANAKIICQDYLVLDRQDFENKYQEFCLLNPSDD